jgi:hypothetical protein
MNKKKLVKSSSSAKRKPFLSRKMLITLIVLGALVLIGVWFLIYTKSINDDKQRFVNANELKNLLLNELIARMGTPIKKDEINKCYNSEQGPWDDGSLWCGAAAVAYYANEVEENVVLDKFKNVANLHSIETKLEFRRLEFKTADKLPCYFQVYSGKFADSPGHGFQVETNTKQTILISCADRALAKHFPYIHY